MLPRTDTRRVRRTEPPVYRAVRPRGLKATPRDVSAFRRAREVPPSPPDWSETQPRRAPAKVPVTPGIAQPRIRVGDTSDVPQEEPTVSHGSAASRAARWSQISWCDMHGTSRKRAARAFLANPRAQTRNIPHRRRTPTRPVPAWGQRSAIHPGPKKSSDRVWGTSRASHLAHPHVGYRQFPGHERDCVGGPRVGRPESRAAQQAALAARGVLVANFVSAATIVPGALLVTTCRRTSTSRSSCRSPPATSSTSRRRT
jgi:hypothetical protein